MDVICAMCVRYPCAYVCVCVCVCVYAISGGEMLKSVDSGERTHELPEDVYATVRSTTDWSVLNDLFILNESLM